MKLKIGAHSLPHSPVTTFKSTPPEDVVVTVKSPVAPSYRAFRIWHLIVSVDLSGASLKMSSPDPSRTKLIRFAVAVVDMPPVKEFCVPYSPESP